MSGLESSKQFEYEQEVHPSLICAACNQPAYEPVAGICGALCCKNCFLSASVCPACQQYHISYPAPLFVMQELDKLIVRCVDCDTSLPRCEFPYHIPSCPGPTTPSIPSLPTDLLSTSEFSSQIDQLKEELLDHINTSMSTLQQHLDDRLDAIVSALEVNLPKAEPLPTADSPFLDSSVYNMNKDEHSLCDGPDEDTAIFISLADEKPLLRCQVSLSSLVSTLKLIIAQNATNTLLEDSKTLSFYNIEKDCVVFMEKCIGVMLRSGLDDFHPFPLDVIASNSVFQVKQQIEPLIGIPAAEIALFIEFASELIELRGHELLEFYEISTDDTIIVSPKESESVSITVKTMSGNREILLELFNDDLVQNIKIELERFEVASAERQILIFNGSVLSDGDSVKEVGIVSGSTLHMVRKSRAQIASLSARRSVKSQLTIKLIRKVGSEDDSEALIDIPVSSSLITVSDLKVRLEELTAIACECQSIVMHGQQLDDHVMMSDLDFHEGHNQLFLIECLPIEVFVTTLSNKILSFKMNDADTVENIKENLSFVEQIPSFNIELLDADNNCLRNSTNLESLGNESISCKMTLKLPVDV
ncbi:hypothetical protein GEMRC1_006046 [Eukaryota sp. GEM-RC1]